MCRDGGRLVPPCCRPSACLPPIPPTTYPSAARSREEDDAEPPLPSRRAGGSDRTVPALHSAAWLRDERRVRELVQRYGSDAREIGPGGWSSLHYAVRGGSAAIVRLLLDAGAPVDAAAQPACQTALHWAAAAGEADCVATLLAAGAAAGAPDGLGRTPLQLAERRLQEAEAEDRRAPFQMRAAELRGARLAVRLLRAAAGAQLPQPAARAGSSQLGASIECGRAEGSASAYTADTELWDGAACCTHHAHHVIKCTPSCVAGLTPGAEPPEAASAAATGAAADVPAAPGTPSLGSPTASAGSLAGVSQEDGSVAAAAGAAGPRRECRVCLEPANELLALLPCGHRATCATCTARLLIPALMAPSAACRCPVCRASVTGSLRVFDC